MLGYGINNDQDKHKKPKQIKTHPTFIYLLNGIQLGKVSGLFLQLENLLNRTGQQRCLCEV